MKWKYRQLTNVIISSVILERHEKSKRLTDGYSTSLNCIKWIFQGKCSINSIYNIRQAISSRQWLNLYVWNTIQVHIWKLKSFFPYKTNIGNKTNDAFLMKKVMYSNICIYTLHSQSVCVCVVSALFITYNICRLWS